MKTDVLFLSCVIVCVFVITFAEFVPSLPCDFETADDYCIIPGPSKIKRGTVKTIIPRYVCRCPDDPSYRSAFAICELACVDETTGTLFKEGKLIFPDHCTYCSCRKGRKSCSRFSCNSPRCVDSVNRDYMCCPTCPNGHNCRTPNGSILSMGESLVLENGSVCRCRGYAEFPSQYAVCKQEGTCTYGNQTFQEGEKYSPDPCTSCFCRRGKMLCRVAKCPDIRCVNPVTNYGECCPLCPNGPNCKTPDGQVLTFGIQTGLDGCRCPGKNEPASQDAVCGAGVVCMYDDQVFKDGETYNPDPCTSCKCERSEMKCNITRCQNQPLTGSVIKPGECCPSLPKFNDCKTPDGTILTSGKYMTLANGSICGCPEDSTEEQMCQLGCSFQNRFYKEEETFKPEICSFCGCFNKKVQCVEVSCAPPRCVDDVTVPGTCCPSCPNGENCMAQNGTIISYGDTLTLDDGSMCRCQERSGRTNLNAICS